MEICVLMKDICQKEIELNSFAEWVS